MHVCLCLCQRWPRVTRTPASKDNPELTENYEKHFRNHVGWTSFSEHWLKPRETLGNDSSMTSEHLHHPPRQPLARTAGLHFTQHPWPGQVSKMPIGRIQGRCLNPASRQTWVRELKTEQSHLVSLLPRTRKTPDVATKGCSFLKYCSFPSLVKSIHVHCKRYLNSQTD